MKPDWQNKSYAKNGAATGPSTMHSKLKVGMSSLHSKIAAATNNMPQAPKPVVRKFADGGMVRGGVMSDEDYAKRMEQGEKNMERLRSAADSIKSFLSPKEKASADNLTGDTGMSETDKAKKAAMSGGAQMPAAAEEPRRQISDYMVKPTETESKTEIQTTPVETGAAPAPAKKVKAAKASVASVSTSAPAKPTETSAQMREKQLRSSGGSRGARMNDVTDNGDETARIMKRSGTKFVPGFGSVDKEGNIVRGQRQAGPSIGDALRAVDKKMTDAGTKYLQSKMNRGETLSAIEKAQAKRAGLI
jgi:hypothetical protein